MLSISMLRNYVVVNKNSYDGRYFQKKFFSSKVAKKKILDEDYEERDFEPDEPELERGQLCEHKSRQSGSVAKAVKPR